MARGRILNGWLNIDKPLGLTSTQVVGRVRRLTQAAKIGHGGTLDPLATGVLPIALGEATKTIPFIMDGVKTYAFTVRWGEARSTDDLEGEVTASSDLRPTAAEIAAVLPRFIGEIEQVPPIYSAIKIDGARAYDLARAGVEIEMKSRRVLIHQLEAVANPVELSGPDYGSFRVTCGKGTYVRSLARDIALTLGTFGHVVVLRRLRVGPFRTEDYDHALGTAGGAAPAQAAISLDNLAELVHIAPPEKILLPVETALDGIPALAVTGSEAQRLKTGLSLKTEQTLQSPSSQQGTVAVMAGDVLIALAALEDGELRPVRVFNL
ncbi:tRNA pseudouridine(55) synthase TruB [Govanella unica]|uniref:tRNA pseudouridine synthase B n=1 Tax=Govanella unica TaxID=2975056 RepID=A0A9X3TZF0_9PROT|nr:tRNA pseudouridine(55) synthase TruB [Govania unica]MDA5194621.1 tRNA pseudouridine(55) synthase TruB [Govania unica]